jgi:hypothetical protein
MKTCEGLDAYELIHIFLTSALAGGEWSASCLGRLTHGERAPRYTFDRLGGPQNRSGRRGEDKNLAPAGTRTPAPRSFSL